MIYFFTGDDHQGLYKKKQDLLGALRIKQPEASFEKIILEDFSEETLTTVLEEQGLFFNKKIISLSQTCEDKNVWGVIQKQLTKIQESEHIILWSEIHNKPIATLRKKIEEIEKHSQKTITKNKTSTVLEKESPNLFVFAEDFFTKNKKEVWLVLQKIREEEPDGDKPLNMLLWQNRAMLQVLRSGTIEESGLKPFVYKKAARALEVWGEENTKKSLVFLVELGREMRMDKQKGYNFLEEYVLSR